MIYYPKSQIKENLFTSGGELQIVSTKKEYKGYYYSTSTGEFFSGKNPQSKTSVMLESIPSLQRNRNEEIPLNYFIINESYYNSRGFPLTSYEAPSPPISTPPNINSKDIQNGFFYRYFAKKGNEGKFLEISQGEYDKLLNQSPNIQWELYVPIKIKWDIQGPRERVYNGNKTVVSLAEQRQNLPGFTLYFKEKFDKFWMGE